MTSSVRVEVTVSVAAGLAGKAASLEVAARAAH